MGINEQYITEPFTTKPFSDMWWRDRLREAKRKELALRNAGHEGQYTELADYYAEVVQFIKRRKGL